MSLSDRRGRLLTALIYLLDSCRSPLSHSLQEIAADDFLSSIDRGADVALIGDRRIR